MDIVTKKKLNILIQLALADKDFAAAERELIYRIAEERNYPREAVQELIDHPEPIGTLGALSERQKVDYLLSSIELVLADHRVVESEIVMSQHIAIKLGFFKHVVDHLIDKLGKVPVQDLQLGSFRQV
ncbi:MAG: hypothetical protein JNN04_10290 [Cyclobacteriaceae bacterium]|nr:hypothetical protein [Cyclobacteriaceae bacterium]